MGCALFLLGRRVRAHFTGPLGVDQLPLKPNRWRALRRQFLNCSEQNVNPFAVLLDCPFKLAQLLALFGLGCRKSRERACFAVSFAALYSARNPCSRGRQQVKFFIYARKSTDDEERQMLSIEAQLAELREYATSEGLNPFYIGLFRYAGELHEGKHKPLVSKKLFDEVQNVMARRGRPHKPRKKPLPYLGLVRCGECGAAVTGERQKGHHYYKCTRKLGPCSQKRFIREEALTDELRAVTARAAIPAEPGALMLKQLAEWRRPASRPLTSANRTIRRRRKSRSEGRRQGGQTGRFPSFKSSSRSRGPSSRRPMPQTIPATKSPEI